MQSYLLCFGTSIIISLESHHAFEYLQLHLNDRTYFLFTLNFSGRHGL